MTIVSKKKLDEILANTKGLNDEQKDAVRAGNVPPAPDAPPVGRGAAPHELPNFSI